MSSSNSPSLGSYVFSQEQELDLLELEIKYNLSEEEVEVLRDVNRNPSLRKVSSASVTSLFSHSSSEQVATPTFGDVDFQPLPTPESKIKNAFEDLWTEDDVSYLDEAFDVSALDAVETIKGKDEEKKVIESGKKAKETRYPKPYGAEERQKRIKKFREKRKRRMMRSVGSPKKTKRPPPSIGRKLKLALRRFNVLTIDKTRAKNAERCCASPAVDVRSVRGRYRIQFEGKGRYPRGKSC